MRSFEDIGFMDDMPTLKAPLLEAYSGEHVVAWYDSIARQITAHLTKYEAAKNHDYADRLRAFLHTWEDNPITGSLNRETLDVLLAAAGQLAADRAWKMSNYFSTLATSLRRLIASEEELPRVEEPPMTRKQKNAMKPAPAADYGPEESPGEAETQPAGAEPETA